MSNISDDKHEHDFVAEKYVVQESTTKYVGNDRYKDVILDIEKVMLFCKKCGEKIEPEVLDE